MPYFGKSSKKRLSTCDDRLQKVFNEVIEHVDCSVLCGHRGKDDQNKAYKEGKSKAKYPNGRHNRQPSLAVDVSPYPIDWDDLERQTLFAGFVLGIAKQMGIDLIWGNDWDGDFETKDTGLKDYPHFELK
jgi:peptidoglycan L-alanyl-D-glutamate endopeptidase CwlK|tara:strand:+ start:235 stop:624 length:390 start_codon:yes stop_codon:yes gene_type:complete